MKGMSKWVSLVALTASIVGTLTIGVVAAAPARADDSGYTDEELVELNTTLVHSTEESTASLAAVNCKTRKFSHVARFTGGKGLAYSVTLRGDWCWRRGNVTSVTWNKDFAVGGQIYNLWQWAGWENTVTGGCVGCNHVYRRVKGHFQLPCVPGLPIICNNDLPYVSLTLRGDGTSAAGHGVG